MSSSGRGTSPCANGLCAVGWVLRDGRRHFMCATCGVEYVPVEGRTTSLWTVEAQGDGCPLCFHPPEAHDGESCSAADGYDHMRGTHDCGCPLTPPARTISGQHE